MPEPISAEERAELRRIAEKATGIKAASDVVMACHRYIAGRWVRADHLYTSRISVNGGPARPVCSNCGKVINQWPTDDPTPKEEP